jgi:hypothetical protein
VLVPVRSASRPSVPGPVGRLEAGLAVAAFGMLCVVALRVRPALVEPDDSLAARLGLPAGLGVGGEPPLEPSRQRRILDPPRPGGPRTRPAPPRSEALLPGLIHLR